MTVLEGKALLDHGKAIARRYAGRIGADVADELGAEAVLHALKSPPPDGRMEPWLERIYRNLFVDRWRRAKNQMVEGVDFSTFAAGSGTPEDVVLSLERRRKVRQGVNRLPREARRAVLSRYFAEHDDEVSAARLGIASATIRTRVHRALARLREHLGDLRGCFPPILVRLLGKLGGQTAAVALAPVLVVAVVAVSPLRVPEASALVVAEPVHSELGTRHAFATPVRIAIPPMSSVHGQARRPSPHVASVDSAPPSPVATFELAEEDTVVGNILLPDGLDVLADPPPSIRSSLVEAPTTFAVQIEKMIEDVL
jgi:RNA polymerase sigma factor (sigma-70 family)